MAKPKLYDCGEAGMLTLAQIADLGGSKWATVRARIQNGWTGAEALAGERVGYRASEAHRWRTAKFRSRVLRYANERLKSPASSVDRLPLAYDPWCLAAIEDAAANGGYSLERTGEILGGITRERVRQIELDAFRKIKRHLPGATRGEIVELLRSVDHARPANTNLFDHVESVERGDFRKSKRKKVAP